MSKRKVSGSSVSINHEINATGRNVTVHGTKTSTNPPITTPTPDHSKGFSAMLPILMGGIPASTGISTTGLSLAMTAAAAVCSAGGINISPDSTGSGFLTAYANVLQYVTNGAYAKNGTLSEAELRKLIMLLISQMLEKAGPSFAHWNQLLMGSMQNATLADFLKGVQSAICAITGDPVNANTGNFIYEKEDLVIKGQIPLSFKRFYNCLDKRRGCMGVGWRHNYEIQLLIEKDRYVIIWDDGREEIYMRKEDGGIEPLFGCLCRLTINESSYSYRTQNGFFYSFNSDGLLTSAKDANAKGLTFLYNKHGKLISVSNGLNSMLQYQYDRVTGALISVCDHTGRRVTLTYELSRLCKVENTLGECYQYNYGDDCTLYQIRNPRNICVLENKYDGKGRTIFQKFANGGVIKYDYQEDLNRTFVMNENGESIVYVHDEKFRNVKTIYIDGEENSSYNDRNWLVAKTDKKGNKTKYSYDDKGNTTQIIYPDGEKRNMTYDTSGHLISLSINGVMKVKNIYSGKGNLSKTTDALGRCREIEYNENGNAVKVTQPDQSQVLFEYDTYGNIACMIDRVGNTTFYEYDVCNRIICATDGNGNKIKFTYDACDRITGVTNADGKSRTYIYTKNGNMARLIDFDGSVTDWEYSNMNQVKSITVPGGGKTCMEYDLMQNVTKCILPNGAELSYVYDSLGRRERTLMPDGASINYEYDPNGNRTAVTDANGNRTNIEYDERNRIASVTDPVGAKTEYQYDMEGNLISITNAMGKSCTYTYNEAGEKTSETDILGNITQYEYNELGKIICITDPRQRKTLYEYALGGLLIRKVYPDGRYERYTYDKNRNLLRCQNHKGEYQKFDYDCLNRVVSVCSSPGKKKSYTYDAVGRVTSVMDALGHMEKYEYSLNGTLGAVIDASGNKTEYGYDVMGKLVTICQHTGSSNLLTGDEIHVTHYERNVLGRIVEVTDPLGKKENYSYNGAGQMILKRDKEGYETSYHYTPAGVLEQIVYGDGRSVAYSYNLLRQLTEIKDWLGTTRIELDDMGRATRITDHKGREINYQWRKTGEQEALIYPNGRKVVYQYDDMFRLSCLIDGEREIKYYYNEDGDLMEKVFSSGITSSYSHNSMGLLSRLTHRLGDKTLEQYSYEYDLVGNKTQIRKQREAFLLSDDRSDNIHRQLDQECGIYQYQYDCMNHLTKVMKNKEILREYRYDAFGNRISKKEEKKTTNYRYNAANQLVEIRGGNALDSFQYDNRGNIVRILQGGETIYEYVYDSANRLGKAVNKKGESAKYLYDGLGNRVNKQEYVKGDLNEIAALSEKTIRDEDYLLDLTKPYHNLLEKTEIVENKSTTQRYTWDSHAVFVTEGETDYTYLQDELGSTVRLVEMEKGGQTVYGYDEFGHDLYDNQGNVQPFGYTGYRKDHVANTYFGQAREYLTELGRFGSQDIIKGDIVYPHTLNEYGYCWANPLKWVDLDGRKPRYPTPDQVWGEIFKELGKSAKKAWVDGWQYVEDRLDGAFDVTVEGGAGLGTKVTSGGVSVGAVAKSYIEVNEHLDATFKGTIGGSVGAPDNLELNAEMTFEENKELYTNVGVNNALFDGEYKLKFGGEIYAGIGGGGYITIDLKETGEILIDLAKGGWEYIQNLTNCSSQN